MTSSKRVKASHHASPLRYPGGKAKLTSYFKALVRRNRLLDCTYVEPFAGGGGVGLALLLHGYVNKIVLNDLSTPIHTFWAALLGRSEDFQERIRSVPLSPIEWKKQRHIFRNPQDFDPFDVGFSVFYLNRTNHSGVLNGGMIGGHAQNSKYGLDARFNREELTARVQRVARMRSQIFIYNLDAAALLSQIDAVCEDEKPLIYLDPPYFRKGRDLYYDFYRAEDHGILRDAVSGLPPSVSWVVSYDNEPEIAALYDDWRSVEYNLSYSVKNGRVGKEVMFFSDDLEIPALYEGGLQELGAAA